MKISILGAGNVGGTLGRAWAANGHDVFFGVPDPQDAKTQQLLKSIGQSVCARTVAEAAGATDLIVLATPWPATRDAIQRAGNLIGKVVVDCTNPLNEDIGGLALGHTTSAAEQVAEWARGAKVFKALNQAGFNIMGNPVFDGQRAVMFVCGDDAGQKSIVLKLVAEIGFEAIDAGSLVIARLLEPYAMLWIHLAYAQGMGREFAFGLLRHKNEAR
jgi:8-hydroxy-5-deazaflavin:NADPH oxidoreductase